MQKNTGKTTKMANPRTGTSWEDYIIEKIQDPVETVQYIMGAIEENDPAYLAIALERVVKVHGISKTAKATKLSRQALYKMLGKKGNPSFANICAILDSLGLTIKIEAKKKKSKSA